MYKKKWEHPELILAALIGKGKDKNKFSRMGILPNSKSGELALKLFRCYRSHHALVGGKNKQIQHWIHTQNKGTQGTPVEQILRVNFSTCNRIPGCYERKKRILKLIMIMYSYEKTQSVENLVTSFNCSTYEYKNKPSRKQHHLFH